MTDGIRPSRQIQYPFRTAAVASPPAARAAGSLPRARDGAGRPRRHRRQSARGIVTAADALSARATPSRGSVAAPPSTVGIGRYPTRCDKRPYTHRTRALRLRRPTPAPGGMVTAGPSSTLPTALGDEENGRRFTCETAPHPRSESAFAGYGTRRGDHQVPPTRHQRRAYTALSPVFEKDNTS